MTPRMAAIFGSEHVEEIREGGAAESVDDEPAAASAAEADNFNEAPPAIAPIIEGTEHFSIYVDDPMGDWPEFIPGYHYDVRQPSRLQPLCRPPRPRAINPEIGSQPF